MAREMAVPRIVPDIVEILWKLSSWLRVRNFRIQMMGKGTDNREMIANREDQKPDSLSILDSWSRRSRILDIYNRRSIGSKGFMVGSPIRTV